MLQVIVCVWFMLGKLYIVQKLIEEIFEIGECDKVMGEDCFIVWLYVCLIDQFDQIFDCVVYYVEINIVIVKM